MSEQKKRDEVYKGLECCDMEQLCLSCPYSGEGQTCTEVLRQDTLGLLKAQEQEVVNLTTKIVELTTAQEPRVLPYDEARANAMRFMNPDSIKPLFIEFRVKDDDDEEALRPPWRGGYNQRLMLGCVSKSQEMQFRADQVAVQGAFPQACWRQVKGKQRRNAA